MPIKPENRGRYPKDWKRIAAEIRARAGERCEGSPDFPDCRALNGAPHPVTGSRVVLTVAHLDHTPEHCDPDNLRAWCQRCHLNYDRKARACIAKGRVLCTHQPSPALCGSRRDDGSCGAAPPHDKAPCPRARVWGEKSTDTQIRRNLPPQRCQLTTEKPVEPPNFHPNACARDGFFASTRARENFHPNARAVSP